MKAQVTVQMEDVTWGLFKEMLAHDGVFDSPADALAWYIRDAMATALEKVRARYAGSEPREDPTARPFMTEGAPCSWEDALATAKEEGRRRRAEGGNGCPSVMLDLDERTWRIWLERNDKEGCGEPGCVLSHLVMMDLAQELEAVRRANGMTALEAECEADRWPYTMDGAPDSWREAVTRAEEEAQVVLFAAPKSLGLARDVIRLHAERAGQEAPASA